MQTFFLAMAMHDDVQKKALIELDEVVGPHRLPRFSDRPSLPFIEAIVRECLRWQTVAPLGIAHQLIADDEYRGFCIPKGTIVMANQWYVI